MRMITIAIGLAVLIGMVWLALLAPSGDEPAIPEPGSDVAVRVDKLTRTTLQAYVTAYGTVAPEPAGDNPAASALVSPSVPGVVVAVNAVEGQRVAKGEVLFQLDSRAADVAAEFAEMALDREQQLMKINGTSEKSLQTAEEQLDAARVQQALLRVQSPLAGTVTRLLVQPGQAVDLATVMAEVVDLDRLVVTAQVPSAELAGLEVGQQAQFTFANAGEPVTGVVSFIGPRIDPQTGTAEVRVALPGTPRLHPGQLGTLRITSGEHADVLAVPIDSVVRDEAGTNVISIVEDDIARRRRVGTGLRDHGLIEVEGDGLEPGMIVVTQGAYGLPDETRVHVVEN